MMPQLTASGFLADVPNAGGASAGRPRLHFKMQFLEALKQKADSFRDAGREVGAVSPFDSLELGS